MQSTTTTAKVSKVSKLTEALINGEALTSAQITARFGLKNPSSAITDIRYSGYAVYANGRKNSKGETVVRYKMGRPSRRIVAAGYRAIAAGLVE